MSDLDLSGEHDEDDEPGEPRQGDGPKVDDEPKPKRSRSRSRRKSTTSRPPRKGATEADLRKRIGDGLAEVIAFVDDRLEWSDVAEAMREDQSRMAEVLAARATKHARLGGALTRIFGKDSALSFARAFGPTLRAAGARARAWREARAGAYPGDGLPLVDADGWVIDPESGQRTGERAVVG